LIVLTTRSAVDEAPRQLLRRVTWHPEISKVTQKNSGSHRSLLVKTGSVGRMEKDHFQVGALSLLPAFVSVRKLGPPAGMNQPIAPQQYGNEPI
jgi:hypothetical protein